MFLSNGDKMMSEKIIRGIRWKNVRKDQKMRAAGEEDD